MAKRAKVNKNTEGDDFIMSPKNDFVFKLLFGDSKNHESLIALLGAVLSLPETEFKNIQILNSELTREFQEDKKGILDIRVGTPNGEQINIEIQVLPTDYMPARTLYYWSKMYTKQLKAGESYRKIKKCITINILDFKFIDIDKIHTEFLLKEKETGHIMTELLGIHFLELPKLAKDIMNELDDDLADIAKVDGNKELLEWLRFINSKTKGEMEMLAKKNEKIKNAYEQLRVISKDEKARMLYEAREAEIKDQLTREEEAEDRGLKKGKIEGIIEGEIKGKIEGIIEGEIKGKIESLLLLLSKKFKNLPNDTKVKISMIRDIDLIDKILDEIFEITSLEDLENYL